MVSRGQEADGGFFRYFLSSSTKDRLADELEATVSMKNSRVQVPVHRLHSPASLAKPPRVDIETDSCDNRTISTQSREEDLFRGQIQFARVQYLKETRSGSGLGTWE